MCMHQYIYMYILLNMHKYVETHESSMNVYMQVLMYIDTYILSV